MSSRRPNCNQELVDDSAITDEAVWITYIIPSDDQDQDKVHLEIISQLFFFNTFIFQNH